jgi:teichuronic acid biosynthesis glycosyltransferase TuaC
MKNIVVISSDYPSRAFPGYGAFVYNLMQELGKEHHVTVISPYKVHHFLKKKQTTYGEEECKVLRPLYFSLSNKNFLMINFGKIGSYFYRKSIERVLNKLPDKPDIIYTHFLSNAIPVLSYANENNVPLVIASGESTYNFWPKITETIKSELKKKVDHLICLSNKNKEQLIKLGFDVSKMSVVPNAVNYSLFKPLDKIACKEKLALSKDKFIIGFIGHFIYRKGPNRIIEAIESLHDTDIQLVCVGSQGILKPNKFTQEIDPVPNYKLPEIFNAFDVFVLPTLNEGHCNVIEEAKACGIPIISSKGTSVEEQMDDTIGMLVAPLKIDEIANAIYTLKIDEKLRLKMIDNLTNRRGEYSLQERASKINEILIKVS